MGFKTVKVAVTGAAGQIGYALLFRLASGQVFGPNVKVILHLIELEQALPALAGVVMELQDSAFPLLQEIKMTSSIAEGFRGVNWALLVGAMPRKAGMERSDLLQNNAAIFGQQGLAIQANAAQDVKVLVVGNPCNTNAYITMKHAPEIPTNRFFSMTMLDQNRATAQLALKAEKTFDKISNVAIWGNHSATQFPDFYHAMIDGQPANKVLSEDWLRKTFIPSVQKRGAEVIKARGASSAASAANGVVDTVSFIEGVHPLGDVLFSVALHSEGQYGAEPGLIVSYPCKRTPSGDIEVIEGWEHCREAKQYLKTTFDELIAEKDAVMQMGLVEA